MVLKPEISERASSSRRSQRAYGGAALSQNPPLPIGTNAINSYNDGGENINLEFAPPVLP